METTEAAQSAAINEIVGRIIDSLRNLENALRSGSDAAVSTMCKDVEAQSSRLQDIISAMGSQRVLLVSSERLMEAGVILYNASRTTQKALVSLQEKSRGRSAIGVQFPVLFTRFMGARVMGLALSCSKDDRQETIGGTCDERSVFVQDCLDVLRSFGRVGAQMLKAAATDSPKCVEYFGLAKEALDNANGIWVRVGLACLTQYADGVELEDILQDLWDFCLDRIRVTRLLSTSVTEADNSSCQDIIETLHELQMLLPYMKDQVESVLGLVGDVLEEWTTQDKAAEVTSLAEEALRLCDSYESSDRPSVTVAIPSFKRKTLITLLNMAGSTGDIQKAEACFSLLGSEKDASVVSAMLDLYLKHELLEKAAIAMKHLLEYDDVSSSLRGARLVVTANRYSEDSVQLFKKLERHYGDAVPRIRLETASCLAESHDQRHREQALMELTHLKDQLNDSNVPQAVAQQFRVDMQLAISEICQRAFDRGSFQESIVWASLGIDTTISPLQSAHFKRLMANAHAKLGNQAESLRLAEDAYSADLSKESLFDVFQAGLSATTNPDEFSSEVIRRLQSRPDFQLHDLVAYGHAAHVAERDRVCLLVMDELCSGLSRNQELIPSLPVSLLLQNTAQLALRVMAESSSGDPSTSDQKSSVHTFLRYVDMYLQCIGSSSTAKAQESTVLKTLEWFYSVSFTIAKSSENSLVFLRAADIAHLAHSLLKEECPVTFCEVDCLLAAMATAIMDADNITDAEGVRAIIRRIQSVAERGRYDEFIAKCELFVRLKAHDRDVEAIRRLCQEKLPRSTEAFVEAAELVLQVASSDKGEAIRPKYRKLAHDLFKHGLQLSLQADEIIPAQVSHLFRRLVNLSDTHVEAYQWLDQLLQLGGSIKIQMPSVEAEWFIVTAWNIGVREHRAQKIKDSNQFMKLALSLAAQFDTHSSLEKDLNEQYQLLMMKTTEDLAIL